MFLLYFIKTLLKYYFVGNGADLFDYIYFYARHVLKKKSLHNILLLEAVKNIYLKLTGTDYPLRFIIKLFYVVYI